MDESNEDGGGDREVDLVVIGSSAGGSGAVEFILSNLPRDAGYPVLVVQHMLPSFTGRFADRLDSSSELDVRESESTDSACGGDCLVAKGDHHLEVVGYGDGCVDVKLTKERKTDTGLRPAVDVTMSSAADAVGEGAVGVLLSGMGSDGVAGLRDIADAGGVTVAQNEESSGVYGMPRRAVEADVVDHVLSSDAVTEWLRTRAKPDGGEAGSTVEEYD